MSKRPVRAARRALVFVLCGATLALVPVEAAAAPTAPPAGPNYVVSMGDSFISGEAGRWAGNSGNPAGNRSGTDLAYVSLFKYNPELIYGASYRNGCNRSIGAEITWVSTHTINLACSGAVTKNVWPGGETFKGEIAQADQLRAVARTKRVSLIVLSISGNDFDFSGIILRCGATTFVPTWKCSPKEQAGFAAKKPGVKVNVVRAIDGIRTAMTQAGYSGNDYRFILQSYPSPLPRADNNRYSANAFRVVPGRCPFTDADSNWARGQLTSELSSFLRGIAGEKNMEFLDMQDAFAGREVCSIATQRSTFGMAPSFDNSEWVRFLNPGTQGQVQESFHPNAFGQRALGTCLAQVAAKAAGNYQCYNRKPYGSVSMITPTSMRAEQVIAQ